MDKKNPNHKLTIRNSTTEFLIFTQQAGEKGIEAYYEDGSIWLTQKLMAELFNVDIRTISEHLQNIFSSNELQEDSVIRNFRITASDGKSYNTQFYNLDAIISVGYRVNSKRATQFRQWATQVLRQFAIKGYVLDKKRLENGNFLGEDYFEQLLAEIREIRLSERHFYQKRFNKWLTLMKGEKYVCLAGHFVDLEKKVMNGRTWITYGWIFEKLKTKKGCDSYFDSCTPTYEKYLQEKAETKRLLLKAQL